MRVRQKSNLERLRTALPDQYRLWLRACLWLALTGYSLVSLAYAGQNGFWQMFGTRDPYAALICLLAVLLERRGRLEGAAWLLVSTVWLEALTTLVRNGAAGSSGPVFPALILAIGTLLGARIAWGFAVLTAVAVPACVHLGGVFGTGPGLLRSEQFHLLVLTISVLASAVLLHIVLRSFTELLKRTWQQAAQAEEMIEHAPDAIVVFDSELRVVEFNPAAERALGVTRPEVLGLPLTALPLLDVDNRTLSTTGSFKSTLHGPTQLVASNTRVNLDALFRRTHHSDGAQRFMMVLRDTTQQRTAERRNKELQTQLQHAQKLEALGLLAGGVAHDFNNLLTTVGGYATLISRSPDARAREYAAELLGAQERGVSLTRQLLSFARKEVVQRRLLDLSQVLAGMRSLLSRLLGEQVKLELQLESPSPILADSGQIEQVMLNLAANARDAMPQGGALRVSCAATHSEVVLVVEDDGPGIDAQTLNRVFEPFFTTKPRGQGTGLGLSTVHGIVTESGGKIEVTSELGRGTRFELRWPKSVSVVAEEPPRSSEVTLARGRGRILLAEDDEYSRRFLKRLLSDAGYEVNVAADGLEALSLLQASPLPPDLLLTDVMMPGLTGVDLAKQVHEQYPLLPVLFISGYLDDVLEDAPYDPVEDLLLKPYAADELLRRIRSKLSARRAEPGNQPLL